MLNGAVPRRAENKCTTGMPSTFPDALAPVLSGNVLGMPQLRHPGEFWNRADPIFATTYCLFGDNAYVQSPYMVVPWRKVGAGAKDAYNFYQSQVRINIECAFGMLVHRWGMLRKPIPNNITVLRTTRLVLALLGRDVAGNHLLPNRAQMPPRPSGYLLESSARFANFQFLATSAACKSRTRLSRT
ncbi:hypothetical protein THAOC_04094 [Thalassiosira oceanica]|uniref:DDE Tnp4 domain-containing protein n=1 Tax=Thalassiosira oceanica TaxID=159749 RepID=K0T662_THAOC|nr:hypothetical protein THAOC_04094 [Thalassiosira oceanica]|eukprot:EJK74238.1 hypothetical protein THAOC_04094 [Thalassiosira oceanica]